MGLSAKTSFMRRPGLLPSAADDLAAELDRLEALELGELRVQYRNRSGRIAPARISRALLLRVLVCRIQVDAFGDVSRETRRLLDRLGSAAAGSPEGAKPPTVPPASQWCLKPGTLLSREWQGRIERVLVHEDGFAWNGITYASLSAVAFAITGTKWNGYRFFGLRNGRTIPGMAGEPGKTVSQEDGRSQEGKARPRRRVGLRARPRPLAVVEEVNRAAPPSLGSPP